jgi:hypothetical protein
VGDGQGNLSPKNISALLLFFPYYPVGDNGDEKLFPHQQKGLQKKWGKFNMRVALQGSEKSLANRFIRRLK